MTKREGETVVATPAEKPRRRVPPRPPSLRTVGSKGESAESKRLAAVVLEVLGGARTPSAAASELGVRVPGQVGHPFRVKSDTYSGGSRTPFR